MMKKLARRYKKSSKLKIWDWLKMSQKVSQNIQNDTPFEYLGLDSIVGGRFASSLSNSFKVEISADDIYKHDNLRSLCEYINLKMNGVEVPGNAVSTKEVQLSDNHSNSVEDIKSNVVFQGPIWTTRT